MLLRTATAGELGKLTARVFDSTDRRSGCRFDAYRIDQHFFIDIDLPGGDPADINVISGQDNLTVRATRGQSTEELTAGPVSREVPDAARLDTDRLEARYEDGVLTVRIPLREPATV